MAEEGLSRGRVRSPCGGQHWLSSWASGCTGPVPAGGRQRPLLGAADSRGRAQGEPKGRLACHGAGLRALGRGHVGSRRIVNGHPLQFLQGRKHQVTQKISTRCGRGWSGVGLSPRVTLVWWPPLLPSCSLVSEGNSGSLLLCVGLKLSSSDLTAFPSVPSHQTQAYWGQILTEVELTDWRDWMVASPWVPISPLSSGIL